ncbi:MAG: HEPN domain-containing protein [Candidatus Acidulodesulfobacterium acidiphilum]|jgi:HEPN domain-containing protein|uniref:HEPN domain-containing protein n=1 Tax=Candidatus Acidulodesulfobacterium acidiphilum TaxID=2597224 RepID=A0A520X658_9DELT|nr:MAG: HEPN domain-containing protein [Candidatus Acidulodesulfobacterium acidiphilum]
MNDELVNLWIIKADHDLKTAKDEITANDPATDTVCFHAQQCVEKYLKAYLVFNGIEIIKSLKTHDISELIDYCKDIDKDFEQLISDNDADRLTNYSIEARYPDDFYLPSVEESNQAIYIAENVKEFVKVKIK